MLADTHAYKEINTQLPQLFVDGCVCVPIKLEPCAFVAFMNAVSFLRESALHRQVEWDHSKSPLQNQLGVQRWKLLNRIILKMNQNM